MTPDADALSHVAKIAIDQRTVYAHAAEMAASPELKAELGRLALTRDPMVGALNIAIVTAGGQTVGEGTLTGTLHDAWVKARNAVGGGDRAAVEEVLKGETSIGDEIDKALAKGGLSAAATGPLVDLRRSLERERTGLLAWKTRLGV